MQNRVEYKVVAEIHKYNHIKKLYIFSSGSADVSSDCEQKPWTELQSK